LGRTGGVVLHIKLKLPVFRLLTMLGAHKAARALPSALVPTSGAPDEDGTPVAVKVMLDVALAFPSVRYVPPLAEADVPPAQLS
jgi:hypothetical protein